LVALLATVTLPRRLPRVNGENVASKVADCPGASIKPSETPPVEKRPPVTLTLEITTLELPAFVKVTLKALPFPSATFPKFKLEVPVVRKADQRRRVACRGRNHF
jgi:hypothetical protein